MPFIYTREQLKSAMNSGIHGKQGMLIDADETVNQAVRNCSTDHDFRSLRRRYALSPNLYNGIFDYNCPSDLDALKIIDIPAQARRQDGDFYLVPTTDFSIHPTPGTIAIKDYNGTRVLQINSQVNDKQLLISELDSLTSGSPTGTSWSLFGDAVSVAADTDDYVKGNGSLKFNLSAAGGTTAGIQNAAVNAADMTNYFGGTSSFFIWAKITSTTNLTNYILRFGTDASNYYYKAVTTQADGTAFVNGWNLLKFDVVSYSTQGSPTITNMKYFVIYMTKTAGKISESDYKFDWLVLKRGVIHNVEYYSKYGWYSVAGAYLADSANDSDYLVADKDEYEIIIEKAKELGNREVKEFDTAREHERIYKEKGKAYQLRNPSEAKIFGSSYHDY